jgi:hypothetical protein
VYSEETADEMTRLQDEIEAKGLWDLDSKVDQAMDARLGVEVVGRLVEEQELGLPQEQAAEGDAAALAARPTRARS